MRATGKKEKQNAVELVYNVLTYGSLQGVYFYEYYQVV